MINFSLIILVLIDGIHTMQNGMQAAPGQFNYVVSIWQISNNNRILCSGTIISETHILTAGHCVHNLQAQQISITAGSVDSGYPNKITLIVTNVHIHPRFKSSKNPTIADTQYWINDIAVLKIKHELMWSINIAPVELDWRATYWTTCEDCYIASWYPVFIDTAVSVSLQWTPAIVISHETAAQAYFFLSTNELPVVLMNDKAAVTNTDAGAPLICGRTQVGIIIGDRHRHTNAATWLTIAPYNDFIDFILHDGRNRIRTFETRNIVSIWHQGKHLCGGIIVDDYHIVTAAHCVHNVKGIDLRVIAGRDQIAEADTTLEWFLVERKEIHPFYEVVTDHQMGGQHIKNDIAVLKVTEKLPWISSMKWDFPNPASLLFGQCLVFRWFQTSSHNRPVLELMKSSAKILNRLQCTRYGVDLEDNKFCAAGTFELPLATHEDIGNPLVCLNDIVGMVVDVGSTVSNIPYPTTFLSIITYKEFINGAMKRSTNS